MARPVEARTKETLLHQARERMETRLAKEYEQSRNKFGGIDTAEGRTALVNQAIEALRQGIDEGLKRGQTLDAYDASRIADELLAAARRAKGKQIAWDGTLAEHRASLPQSAAARIAVAEELRTASRLGVIPGDKPLPPSEFLAAAMHGIEKEYRKANRAPDEDAISYALVQLRHAIPGDPVSTATAEDIFRKAGRAIVEAEGKGRRWDGTIERSLPRHVTAGEWVKRVAQPEARKETGKKNDVRRLLCELGQGLGKTGVSILGVPCEIAPRNEEIAATKATGQNR